VRAFEEQHEIRPVLGRDDLRERDVPDAHVVERGHRRMQRVAEQLRGQGSTSAARKTTSAMSISCPKTRLIRLG
jgi:hypothetical protein